MPAADLLPQSSSINTLPSSFSSFPIIFLCECLDGTNQKECCFERRSYQQKPHLVVCGRERDRQTNRESSDRAEQLAARQGNKDVGQPQQGAALNVDHGGGDGSGVAPCVSAVCGLSSVLWYEVLHPRKLWSWYSCPHS